MATRAERFKSEQAKEHARQHAQPSGAAAAAKNGNGAGAGNGKAVKVATKPAKKTTKDHIKSATPLTSRELLLNMSPSARHQRRT